MKPSDEDARLKLVPEWFFKVDHDKDAAEALLVREPPLLFASCFHAQQAAEKWLKALLTWWEIEPPKTHNIGQLLRLAASRDAPFAESLLNAVALNPYAVVSRYPGDQPEPSRQEAQQAIGAACAVRAAVLGVLPARFGPSAAERT